MTATGNLEGIPMQWKARRPAVRPGSAPARHEFTPNVFYRQFAGDKPPALRIFPGDTYVQLRLTESTPTTKGVIIATYELAGA